jgi:hypothetical protein
MPAPERRAAVSLQGVPQGLQLSLLDAAMILFDPVVEIAIGPMARSFGRLQMVRRFCQ